jgi:hypothetical protein
MAAVAPRAMHVAAAARPPARSTCAFAPRGYRRGMLSVTRHRVPVTDADGFLAAAGDVVAVLAERRGFVRARVCRATDDPELWLLVSEWADVGSFRRALGSTEVRLRAFPLLAGAADEPSGFETLTSLDAGGTAVTTASALAPGAASRREGTGPG